MRDDQRRASHVGVFVTKQLSIVIAVLGLLLVTVSASADEFSDGLDAYRRGDYAEALKLWRPAAEQGNASAQFNLGFMYDLGNGISTPFNSTLNAVAGITVNSSPRSRPVTQLGQKPR